MSDVRHDGFVHDLQENDLLMIGGQFYKILSITDIRLADSRDLTLNHVKVGHTITLEMPSDTIITFRRPV